MAFLMGLLYSYDSKKMNEKQSLKILVILFIILFSTIAKSENKIIIASTTSTYDTGLLNLLNDKFYNKFNIRVQV